MKVTFRFENGSSECILTPENPRDKSYIDLCIDGRPDVKLKSTSMDSLILTFTESKPKVHIVDPDPNMPRELIPDPYAEQVKP